MVDFTTPDLPGASEVYNKIASKVAEVEKNVMDNLEATASDLKAKLEPDLLDLKAKTQGMIPELPTAPSLNLQSEITALSSLTAGSDAHIAKLAAIGSSFGSAITAGGYSLDSITTAGASALKEAASIASGGLPSLTGGLPTPSSLAAAIPNMELPPGATEAIEVAKAALQPTVDVLKEAVSEFSTDMSEDDSLGLYGDAYATTTLGDAAKALVAQAEAFAAAFESRQNRIIQESAEVEI